jgi:hypothetical protein
MLCPFALVAEGFRVATFHAELTRKGPGLLLRDVLRGKDEQIAALEQINATVRPDVLLLTKVDFDLEKRTAKALQHALGYAHSFALAPNSMIPTDLDLDGDGRAMDRQTWARYAGEGAMLLSQHPVALKYHLADLAWKDMQNPKMPIDAAGQPFPSKPAQDVQKVVSQGLWIVEIRPKSKTSFTAVLFQNQTPVFDGPEDQNGLRNAAQLRLLEDVMRGQYGSFPKDRFVLIGNTNLDPNAGAGDRGAMLDLLNDKRLQDPRPRNRLGEDATVVWEKAGPMRVSYVLPSADWTVERAELFWPKDGPLRQAAEQASRHKMVWVQITPRPQ